MEALGLGIKLATNPWTPVEQNPLVKDAHVEGYQGSFGYSTVVGILLSLSGHSQPGIAYVVNCCTRYMFNPRLSHKKALKSIWQVS